MANLLFGIHDREGAHIVPSGGWVVDTVALSENPRPTDYMALRRDVNWIVRLNHGYGSTGTIPLPDKYQEFANACAEYVAKSNGANIFVLGNEPNHEQERPNGAYISPERYAHFFVRARTLIKTIDPNACVIPAPCAPYHANPIPWNNYQAEMLTIIANNGGCDGLAVHAYTRSSDPKDITSSAKMGPPLEDTFSGFWTYMDALDAVPQNMRRLPVYITEFNELLPDGWHDANTGVVQAAYADIHDWNLDEGDFPIQCLCLYRWPQYDKWHIEGKQGVIDDFRAAVAKGYPSPQLSAQGGDPEQNFIPSVSTGGDSPMPDLPRDIDPRLTERGVTIETPPLQPGQAYWRVKSARWFSEAEAGGRHHIYVEALTPDGRPVAGVPFYVEWPSGQDRKLTNGRSGFDAGNYPMSPSLHEFSVRIMGAPSEVVKGIGMGADGNPGIHTSTLVTFQLATVPESKPQPEVSTGPTPVEPPAKEPTPQPEPSAPMPAGIIEPRVAQAILRVESGGRALGENSKPIIRFESHIFKQQLGDDEAWGYYFSAHPVQGWKDQKFRKSPGEPWRTIHTGNQADEYAALEVARRINAEAAYRSISVGAGQIMGFNHARIGYPSAQAMFKAFEDEQVQIIGFINFFLSDPALVEAMRRKDWREIARRFNGAGAIDTYAPLLERTYRELGGT